MPETQTQPAAASATTKGKVAKRTVVFIFTENMRSTQSPYATEGTDIKMDIPSEYPLPPETMVLDTKGAPVNLRWIPSSNTIDKMVQIENKFPEKFNYTDDMRGKLTFKFGRLELDTQKDKAAIDYVRAAGWMKGNDKTRLNNTRVIYEEYNEDNLIDEQIKLEDKINKAKSAIMALKPGEIRELYFLATPTGVRNDQMSTQKQQYQLLLLANNNPEFILNGIKSNYDKLSVLASKAIDHKILDLGIPGIIALQSATGPDYEPLLEATEAGGFEGKFERFVEYLTTEEGSTIVSILQKRVEEKEKTIENED